MFDLCRVIGIKRIKFLWWTYHKPSTGSHTWWTHLVMLSIKGKRYNHQVVWQIFIHPQLNGARGVKTESSIRMYHWIHTTPSTLLSTEVYTEQRRAAAVTFQSDFSAIRVSFITQFSCSPPGIWNMFQGRLLKGFSPPIITDLQCPKIDLNIFGANYLRPAEHDSLSSSSHFTPTELITD